MIKRKPRLLSVTLILKLKKYCNQYRGVIPSNKHKKKPLLSAMDKRGFYFRLEDSQICDILSLTNRDLEEVTLMEYGVVVAVIFVIAIGIYAGLKNKKKR